MKEAEQLYRKIARVNGKELPEEGLEIDTRTDDKTRLGDIRDLFKTKSLTRTTLISWFCWWVIKGHRHMTSIFFFFYHKEHRCSHNSSPDYTVWSLSIRLFESKVGRGRKIGGEENGRKVFLHFSPPPHSPLPLGRPGFYMLVFQKHFV